MDINLKIQQTINTSPSVKLLLLRNREMIVEFFVRVFWDKKQPTISYENLFNQLTDFLDSKQVESDEDIGITPFDTYEEKAKKYIRNWTGKGFLTNYADEKGVVFYELSSHSSKTIDWLVNLKKVNFIGTESKFHAIYQQLKELVEFTNEDVEKRIELLEQKKLEIEQQIQQIKTGEDVKVFEDYQIIPRFNQLNQSAKELLSDFKEVEDNFKEITKKIYQKHSDSNLNKNDILTFTFDALDELKESQQGKSFYEFWSFIINPSLQEDWDNLTDELYQSLENKEISVNDFFLKGMKKHLHYAGKKVYQANDKMADKLSRIIRENEDSQYEATTNIIKEIKQQLIETSKQRKSPDISFELELNSDIHIPFERSLTFDKKEQITYDLKPVLADNNLSSFEKLEKLYSQSAIDRKELRKRIKTILNEKSQVTLCDVVENYGGLKQGLAELFGYISIVKDFKHSIHSEKTQNIIFDSRQHKQIRVPEIILSR